MTHRILATLALLSLAEPAFAGDPAAGQKLWNSCKSCHSIIAPDGTVIQKGGKLAPNLYGVIGRTLGSVEGFKYGAPVLAAKDKGLAWDEASLAAYVADPSAWLRTALGDDTAKSNMTFKLKSGGEDIAAYLASVK